MQTILVTAVIMVSLAAVALAGKCVVCRSDRVAGCGETMDPKIINDHIQQCNSSSCDKRINEEFHTVVIRQCGLDGNFDEEYYSAKCKEMTNIKVCKCRGDVCNGQSNIVSSLTVLISAVLAALVLLR